MTRPQAQVRFETAMVLAAGHGTRLRPLTEERPKPLLEVLGRPLASFALEHAHRLGAKRTILNTHHLGPQISKALGTSFSPRGSRKKMALQFSPEPTLLGTGGGLRQMWRRLLAAGPVTGPVLILNADALIDLDTDALVSMFLRGGTHPLSVMVLKKQPDAARYGLIGATSRGRVTHFAGRAEAPGSSPASRERMFCGVHLVDPGLFDMVPAPPYPPEGVCINRLGYPPAIASGEEVRSIDHRGIFWDVGTPLRLLEANLRLLGGQDRLRHIDAFAGYTPWPSLDRMISGRDRVSPARRGRVYLGANVRIESGAQIMGPVLLGAGVVVKKGAKIGPYVVAGPGANLGHANLSNSVVLSNTALSRAAQNAEVRGAILGRAHRAVVPEADVTASLRRPAERTGS